MIKILWVCNLPLLEVQNIFGIKSYNESWLTGISNQLRKREDIVLHYAFPQNRFKRTINKRINGITFWGFYNWNSNPYKLHKEREADIKTIIDIITPDIVHIFGTEYAHSLECIYSIKNDKKILVSLQGLTSELAKVYSKGIPIRNQLIGKIVSNKYQCILKEKYVFYQRGKNEIKVLSQIRNAIGRTDWDKACLKKINPTCAYYHCNEILRDTFYDGNWDISKIKRNSIFMSQASYPIKGLHILILALPIIKKKYPDVQVYVAGDKGFLTESAYGDYVSSIIRKNNVERNILFLGSLSAEKIKKRMLKSHIMLMPSLLENSPNSVGEAMKIGTPVIASEIGGIPSMVHNKVEGLLYSPMDKSELAKKVCYIFSHDNLALFLSENGRKIAGNLYDRKRNIEQLMKIYNDIINRV